MSYLLHLPHTAPRVEEAGSRAAEAGSAGCAGPGHQEPCGCPHALIHVRFTTNGSTAF